MVNELGVGAQVVVVVIVLVLEKSCIGCMGYTRMMGGGLISNNLIIVVHEGGVQGYRCVCLYTGLK